MHLNTKIKIFNAKLLLLKKINEIYFMTLISQDNSISGKRNGTLFFNIGPQK